MAPRIRKVVFPVAGLGTRFLPASKVIAKEMLPIVDRPLIQFAVEEAVEAGADTLVFVINRNKRQIADHFDTAFELESKLLAQGKHELLAAARDVLPKGVSAVYVTQQEALGLGHAVLCARPVIGDEAFGIILPDDFIYSPGNGALKQMADLHQSSGLGVIAVENVDPAHTDRYGIVSALSISERVASIQAIVEKPKPDVAPSTLAVVGRYILHSRIFALLEQVKPGAGGEIQLTDGIAALLAEQGVSAYRFLGTRYDCGTKLGFVQATLALALADPQLRAQVAKSTRALLDAS